MVDRKCSYYVPQGDLCSVRVENGAEGVGARCYSDNRERCPTCLNERDSVNSNFRRYDLYQIAGEG